MKDYYRILGVSRDAGQEEIKRAFRRVARESHPDANPDDPDSEARFREVAEAYEVLSDARRRTAYDRGDRVEVGDLFSRLAGFEDLFDLFFGAGTFGRPGRASSPPGRDVGITVEVELSEAAFGTTREVSFPVVVACESCGGSGASSGSSPQTCSRCGGSGALRITRRGFMGSLMSVTACDRCGGQGSVISDPCVECRGEGVVEGSRTLTVEIPAGVTDRSRLRLSGRGESGRRQAPTGDLYIEVRVRPHELFERQGDDLRHRLRVGMAQAALGAEVEVPLLEGETVTVDLPRGTQPGTVLRVAGKGVSRLGGRGRGDLLVEVEVEVPTQLSAAEEEALRTYAGRRGEGVRRPRRWGLG